MSKVTNRRTSFRMPFISKLVCQVKGSEKKYDGTLRDISITGLFVEMDEYPAVGNTCEMKIYLEGDHSRLVIEKVSGKIVRSDSKGVAIVFDNRLEWFVLIPLYFQKICGKAKLTSDSSRLDCQAMVSELSAD
jgi:hypothetical protein